MKQGIGYWLIQLSNDLINSLLEVECLTDTPIRRGFNRDIHIIFQ